MSYLKACPTKVFGRVNYEEPDITVRAQVSKIFYIKKQTRVFFLFYNYMAYRKLMSVFHAYFVSFTQKEQLNRFRLTIFRCFIERPKIFSHFSLFHLTIEGKIFDRSLHFLNKITNVLFIIWTRILFALQEYVKYFSKSGKLSPNVSKTET